MIRIIPSLDGSLYKYFAANNNTASNLKADYIEKIPFTMEELLKKSIKMNKDITFIGGLLTETIGIDIRNGKVTKNALYKIILR
jgi:hypothetical protein